ncbi:MAG TPA: single-stranded-DNA-specific exonuclease RecJ [Caldilineae bacterium]|nr:single-stranded-DNA-specific exonuclease RecJ [Caldilineae bacterium]
MTIIPTQWELPSPVPPHVRARYPHLHPIIQQILYNRGVTEPDDVAEFFGQRTRSDDPFRLIGVTEAVTRLRRAIQQGRAIAVYGDFDADGVTSTAVMVQTLRALGAQVTPYIPHRVDEGYGLNTGALEWLKSQGIRTVVTVDCGIRAMEEVAFGKAIGLEMIITDHHSIGSEVPDADVVVNPKLPESKYPFRDFAGVGVAFKLAQALLRVEANSPVAPKPVTLTEEDLLDLVALGTVADIMPLVGENRILVQRGLEALRAAHRPGIRALAQRSGLDPREIDATAIGFRLGPRLNAAGRLESAVLAYNLLMATTSAQAEEIAYQLDMLNRQRQALTNEAVQWAIRELGDHPPEHVLLVARDDLNPGIAGLVASRLKEHYFRPALVAHLNGDAARGSARSIPQFHITHALDQCAELLIRYGGHAAAAGFTLPIDNLPQLRRCLNAIAAEQIRPADLIKSLDIDVIAPLRELDYALLNKLQELEPTGSANPRPVIAIPDLLVKGQYLVGSEGKHLKLRLSDGVVTFDAIAFGQAQRTEPLPMRVDVAAYLTENVWRDRRSLQLQILDIKPAGRGVPPELRPA